MCESQLFLIHKKQSKIKIDHTLGIDSGSLMCKRALFP